MNKQDLIDAVATSTGLSKVTTEQALNGLTAVLHEQLGAGNEVTLHGVGKFKVQARKARTGRNPSNGEAINIPAKNSPAFTAAKALKDAVN